MDLTQVFACNVRAYRKARGLTQSALAERAFRHRTFIGSIECGRRNATLQTVENIAVALGVAPAFLLLEGYRGIGTRLAGAREALPPRYALASLEGGEMDLRPIEVLDENLSRRILRDLAEKGYRGDDLARRYTEVQEELVRHYRRLEP